MFANRIKIDAISINAYGDLTIYYDDDDMFLGYTIVVAVCANREMESADIEG